MIVNKLLDVTHLRIIWNDKHINTLIQKINSNLTYSVKSRGSKM